MGIAINVDTYLLCSMFNISSKKITDDYSGMSIEEIMKAEAANGNAAAANFDSSILNDPVKLIELFQLKDPANKYAILSNMNENDLKELLPLLEAADLAQGLNYFSKDKLLNMSEELPKEQLTKMTLEMFSPEQLIQLMPEDQINKVLTSDKMDPNIEKKYLQTLKPEILAQMLEATTGQQSAGSNESDISGQTNLDGQSLANQIASLPDDKFQEAMINIPPQNKRDFMVKLAKEDPKILQLFDSSAFTKIIGNKKDKSEIIKASSALKPESLVKMIAQLPHDLTAAVLTQLDTKKFADVLQSKFKNIISQLVAG